MTSGSRGVELSVVVPLRDAATTIGAQLDALRAQQWDGTWEVVVADNGSRDGSDALVADIAAVDPRVHLVDASATAGPSAARNAGAAAARGTSLVFCDADDVVGAGWLAAVADGLRRDEAVTGPQEQERLNPPWLAGVHGTAVAQGQQWFEGIFPYGPSANLGIRRAVFEEIGRFDESITAGEDLELCLRLWRSGHRLTYLPGAVVHYRNRSRLGDLFRQAITYGAAGPLTVRRLVEHGAPRPSRTSGLRSWLWLVRNLPLLRSRAGRARWIVVAGRAVGRLIGTARHRTVFL
ncbi:MAG: glycosyltransferase [Acidimicrobiales bacterium]